MLPTKQLATSRTFFVVRNITEPTRKRGVDERDVDELMPPNRHKFGVGVLGTDPISRI
jgi:hypothetical protein